jgi:lysophospholipase L1-like esterase
LSPRPSNRSAARQRGLVLALGTLFALGVFGVLEAVVRLSGRIPAEPYPMAMAPSDDAVFTWDPELFWRPKPDVVNELAGIRTNSLGFRDTEFPVETDLPVFTVLCLGDSPTWGDNVPGHTPYPAVLEKELKALRPYLSVQVLNAGVPAYTTTQALVLERELLARFDFDVVTIASQGSDSFLASRPDADYVMSPSRAAVARLLMRSWLFRLVREMVAGGYAESPGYDEQMVHRVPARPDYEQQLTEMVELARDDGAEVLLLQPFPLCLDGTCPISSGSVDIETFLTMAQRIEEASGDYRAAMDDVGRTTGTGVVDLAEVVRDAARPSALYVDQVHPGTEGHARIARVIAAEIVDWMPAYSP